MYGRKRAKTHVMFELRSQEGMHKKLIVNHLCEDPKKFVEFFRLSLEQLDFLVELINDDMSKKSWGVKPQMRLYSPPSRATIWIQR